MKYLALVLLLVACNPKDQHPSLKLKLLAQATLPSNISLDSAPFGGISGMVNIGNDEYLAISDDRSELAPARMIKLKIEYSNKDLKVTPINNITLKRNGAPFKLNELDSEAIALHDQTLLIASEGSYRKGLRSAPFIRQFDFDGNQGIDIAFNEDRFVPEATGEITKGVRPNLGFESLTFSPDGKSLFVVTEAALIQDAPSDYLAQNIVRLMAIDPTGKKPTKEYAIKLDHVQVDGAGGIQTGHNGISDIKALSDTEILIMERSWISSIKRQIVRLYTVKLDELAEVSSLDKLTDQTVVLKKELLLDLDELNIKLDNLEVLCDGPIINGKKSLIIASDNNFSNSQLNQFLLFEILPR